MRLRYSSVDELVRAHLFNPALDGVSVVASVDAAVGTRLELTIDFGSKAFRTQAEIAICKPASGGQPGTLGLRFVDLAPELRAWLQKAVADYHARQLGTVADRAAEEHMLRKAVSARDLSVSQEDLAPTVAQEAQAGPVIGIDLGTCNSAACVIVGGKPQIIDLRDELDQRPGVHSIPSVIAFDDAGGERIGATALAGLSDNPRRTIFGAKRFIGRTYDSPVVQEMLPRFPYRVVPGPGGRVAVEINGQPMALTAISGRILRTIKRRAELQLHTTINRAIITVPAYYNDNQRDAVMQAGRLAGLTVERILNEPTAAAVAYGLTRSTPRRLIVYDLGGGTFDVSVMSVHHNSLQVLATAGDTFLGGEDFDAAIVRYVLGELARKTGKQPTHNSAALAPVKQAAEQAKRRLSLNDRTSIVVKDVPLADSSTARLEVELTRAKLEQLVEPLVTRTLKICDMALREAHLEASQLGDVILVGGQTLMPYVRERVREHFKVAPRCDLNPDEVVALGAGLLGQLSAAERTQLKDVLSMSIGVAVGGRLKPVIPRNTPVPCAKSFGITVAKDQFATYALDVWQGDAPVLHQNEHLGTLQVNAVEPGPENPVRVHVEFALSADCLLKVRVTNVATEESQQVLLTTRDTTVAARARSA